MEPFGVVDASRSVAPRSRCRSRENRTTCRYEPWDGTRGTASCMVTPNGRWISTAIGLWCAACSADPSTGGRPRGDPPAGAADGSTGIAVDAPLVVVGNDAGSIRVDPQDGKATDGCTDQAKNFIYVLGVSPTAFATVLYKFAPDKKEFTLVGNLNCGGNGDVNSMAVDRKGTAWVNWGNQVFQVSTTDASCSPAPAINLAMDWARIGMGFSNDAPGSASETLFVAQRLAMGANGSAALGRLSATGALDPVGPFSGGGISGLDAELTGTGDARLYAFFIKGDNRDANFDPLLGLIDKATASVSKPVTLKGVSAATSGGNCTNGGGCIRDWAFSFWGGRFYFYTAAQTNSMVTEYDPLADGGTGITLNYATAPLQIVGAGVSTCAPTTPPIVR